jgi:sugar lactone lactonase YvrE
VLTVYTPKSVLAVQAELGEHPIWSEEEQSLYWLDILGSKINRFDPETGRNHVWELPVFPGCFAFRKGSGAVLAAHNGIYDVDFLTGGTELILPATHDPAILRFNDGRTDRQGRFWAGTVRRDMDRDNTAENAYYRYDSRGLTKMLTNVGLTNGTAFSPSGKIMYRAQSETRQIFAYDYDTATGTPSNERLFVALPEEYGMPDGATIDMHGAYWVAVAVPPGSDSKAGVLRFLPDGSLDLFIALPVPFVTMPAFGGRNLSTLYITTARLEAFMPDGVPEGAGDIFAVETPFQGVPETPFQLV